ncbi:MAG: ARMT1-like domain-containing protein [Thermodesulfobacteriota bacterium]|nr:ARMT1-like domain-containing protein [Thermodesulfobacteriota bacterium]
MKTYFDCIPCFVRQTLEASRIATSDEKLQEKILRGVLAKVSDMDFGQSPPVMGQYIHRLIRKISGNQDPYQKLKHNFNKLALGIYAELSDRVKNAADPFEAAVRFAIAGNIIDSGAVHHLTKPYIMATIEQAMSQELSGNIEKLRTAANSAKKILYLGDNTGEIVFDKLLIQQLPADRVTFVVRGYPVINDATLADAKLTGLTDIVEVIDNGSDAPGTILENCSPEFLTQFFAADLVLAKGQGNYETLSSADQNIFFILKAKCPVIARDIGCEIGSLVIKDIN